MRGKLAFGAATAALLMFVPTAWGQVADPPGDNTTQARVTDSADGAIEQAGDVDWYRLTVQQGQRYRITLDGVPVPDGTALDPMLAIYDASGGNQLAFNDDSRGSLNSALSFSPQQSGDVFIEARGFSDQATGAYHLAVSNSAGAADDVGNDATTRARLTPGSAVTGAVEEEGDVDWYRMSVRTGQRYHLTLEGAGDEPLGDTIVRVLDRDGTELASNDDAGDGTLNSALDFVPQASGDVFVEARGYGDAYVGSYTLNATATRAPTDSISGDRNTRGHADIGRDTAGSLDFAGDHDWYRVRLQAGQSYRFLLNSAEGDAALSDPLIKLYNSNGDEIGSDDDGGEGLNAYLEYTAATAGTYFVEARAFDETTATGSYVLSARAGDIADDMSTDASVSADGDYRDGTLAPAGDHDWYKIDLAEGQGIRVSLNAGDGSDALSDPLVILHGPDGSQIMQDDDGGEGLNSWFEYQATTAGAYFIEARGFVDDAAGKYVLTITPGEIGNSAEGAEIMQANTEGRTARLGTNDDVDWFAIDLIEGRPYRFYVAGAEGDDALADPLLTLYDSDGKQVAVDDDGGSGVNAYLNFVSVTGGAYYAAVSSFNGAGSGRYTVRVADTDVPGNVSTDETLDQAGDDRIGNIEIAGDRDDYRVDLEAGVHYLIELNGNGDNPLRDPMLKVLNTDNGEVASDDDGGSGRNSRLRFTPEASGSFVLQASGVGGSIGGYQISIVRQQ